MKRMPIAGEWLKYNRYETILRIIYSPILYFFILAAVNVIGTSVLCGIYIKNKGLDEVTARESYEFSEKIKEYVEGNSVWLSLIAALVGILIFGFIYYKDYKSGIIDRTGTAVDRKIIIIISVITIFANIGLSRFLTILPIDGLIGNYKKTQESLLSGSIILQITASAIFVPVVEELVYRGIMQRRLFNVMPETGAMILSSLAFSIFHFNLVQGIYALILGLFLGYCYNQFKKLEICIYIHGLANLTAVLVNYSMISRFINSYILIGILVMMIEIGVGIYMFWMLNNKMLSKVNEE